MKVNMLAATRPGAVRGRMMRNNAPILEQPSIVAHSSISLGMPWTNPQRIQIASGRFRAV